MQTLPIFPLPAVLYPGGVLPLQIFESKYLQMVKHCLATGENFVVVQSASPSEPEDSDVFYSVGCIAKIKEWRPLPGHILGIDIVGLQRVKIHNINHAPGHASTADCELLLEPEQAITEQQYPNLVKLLNDIAKHPLIKLTDIDYDSASDVGFRLAEHLPFTSAEKQLLLESTQPLVRLDTIETLIRELNV